MWSSSAAMFAKLNKAMPPAAAITRTKLPNAIDSIVAMRMVDFMGLLWPGGQ